MMRQANQKVWLAAWLFVALLAGTVEARVIYVDTNAPGPIHNGTSWDTAYRYLQDALAEAHAAADVNEIRVGQGTYKPDRDWFYPNGTGNRSAAFVLADDVALKGGYAGYGRPDPNARNIALYEAVLSGDLGGDDARVNDPCDLHTEPTRSENSYHVVTGGTTDANAVLGGFTITGGNADGSDPDNRGGGMYNHSAGPNVINCTFVANCADLGGAMQNDASSPILTNCTFLANAGLSYGGAINNNNASSPTITDSTFENNCAQRGGGIYNYGDQALTKNCLFVGNSAPAGAAMYNDTSTGRVTNCTFADNAARNGGGGIYNMGSTTTVTNCIFRGNTDLMGAGESGQIFGLGTIINYSCVQGWTGVFGGSGNFDEDPCFARPGYWVDVNDHNIVVGPDHPNAVWIGGDYHLKSESGRWDLSSQSWVRDVVTSACIDKGDPNDPPADEPAYNGGIINTGAYGGTARASVSLTCWSPSVCPGQRYGDATCDGKVDLADLFALKRYFGSCSPWGVGNCCANFDHDTCICLSDLFTIKAGFGTSGYGPSTGNLYCPSVGRGCKKAKSEAQGCPDLAR